MKAQLFVLGGRHVGDSFVLDGQAVAGRESACEVRLTDRSISRQHARFEYEGLDWVVVDLGSRNGLRVDGKRVERAVLSDGLEVMLGEVPLRFRIEQAEADEPPPAPTIVDADAEIELEDEILLDQEAPVAETRTAMAPGRGVPHAPAIPQDAVESAPPERPVAPPSTLSGSDLRRAEILAEGKRSGPLGGDLSQQPGWIRVLIAVVLLAAAGGIVAGMFHLVRGMRSTM